MCGYRGKKIYKKYNNTFQNLVPISCIIEKKPLGTGGAIKSLEKKITKNFIALNGDTFFDIDLSSRKTHGALIDSKLLAKVYLELKGGQQPNLILNPKDDKKRKEEINISEKKILKDRKFVLSNEDTKNHKDFLKKIKNPIWNQYN